MIVGTGIVVAEREPETCLERVLVTRLLEPHLGPPGVALDLAGGTGPYAVWLIELGWDVRGRAHGAVFEAVLGLDPLLPPTRRLARLTRPGGLLALAVAPHGPVGVPGFDTVTVAAPHALATGHDEELEALRLVDPDGYRATLDRLVSTADDPALLATADHLLWVGRRAQLR